MSDLRKYAKGKPCQIRIPGVCNGDPETTVLCHIHKPSISGGIGLKANDLLAAWGCSACHKLVDVDLRYHDGNGWVDETHVKAMFYEGIFRTQSRLIDEGII